MIELIGYHGTVKTSAEKILSSKEFIESNNDNEWLGHGIYFFADIENAIKKAKPISEMLDLGLTLEEIAKTITGDNNIEILENDLTKK